MTSLPFSATPARTSCAPAARWPNLHSLFGLWRSRRALAQLSAEQLHDIGLTVEDAAQEARRAPWDVPAHWRG